MLTGRTGPRKNETNAQIRSGNETRRAPPARGEASGPPRRRPTAPLPRQVWRGPLHELLTALLWVETKTDWMRRMSSGATRGMRTWSHQPHMRV